jgi:hypothetical protein
MGPNLDSFGHMGQLNQTHNACVPLKNDFVVLAYGARELRSEEQGLKFDELANGDQELKQPTISPRLQATMPNSIWNVEESNTCSETDDLVMKACHDAFRGLLPRRVSNMNMSEDNGSTRVLPLYQRAHSTMMQRMNGNASYTLSSTHYQQSQGVTLPPVDNGFSFHPISIDRDTSPISDLSISATLFEEEVEFGLNKSNFTTYSSSPEPSLNREVKDDFAQFINDTLPPFDDENWV